jgi:glycosyltransferase involved in cell wall biosynthesis
VSSPDAERAPLVSVLTPSLNQGRFVEDCIRSVAAQTYKPLEHVICDGGSTDGTLAILRSAPATVSWASEPDRGQSHALNKALRLSRGEIVGWLNSDDAYLDREAVSSVVETFRLHPDVDVIYGHAALVNADGLILQLLWSPPFSYRLLRFENFIAQPAVFIRRRILGDAIVDESYEYAMDAELWLRLGRAHRFWRIDRVLAIDRHQADRKVYTRGDLAEADERKLVLAYGVRPHVRRRPVRWAYRALARVLGLRLLPAAFGPHACAAKVDRLSALLLRQLLLPRRAMPLESGPARDRSGRTAPPG